MRQSYWSRTCYYYTQSYWSRTRYYYTQSYWSRIYKLHTQSYWSNIYLYWAFFEWVKTFNTVHYAHHSLSHIHSFQNRAPNNHLYEKYNLQKTFLLFNISKIILKNKNLSHHHTSHIWSRTRCYRATILLIENI